MRLLLCYGCREKLERIGDCKMERIKGIFLKLTAIAAVFFVAGFAAIQLESVQDWVLLRVLSSATVVTPVPPQSQMR